MLIQGLNREDNRIVGFGQEVLKKRVLKNMSGKNNCI